MIPGIDMSQPCDVGCGAHIHTGPHWLHMDRHDHAEHLRLLRLAVQTHNGALAGYVAQAEIRRLTANEHQLRAHGCWTAPPTTEETADVADPPASR